MGNVNESKERGRVDSPGSDSTVDFEDNDSLSSSVLDYDASTSDLPIKLFFPSRPSPSEFESEDRDPLRAAELSKNPNLPNIHDVEPPTVQHEVAYTKAPEPREELPKDDSFPLSESALPVSFDLLVEPSPILSDGSDIFHTPDMSNLDLVESNLTEFQTSYGVETKSSFLPADISNAHITQVSENVHAHHVLLGATEYTPEELFIQRLQGESTTILPIQNRILVKKEVFFEDEEIKELNYAEVCEEHEKLQSESLRQITKDTNSEEYITSSRVPYSTVHKMAERQAITVIGKISESSEDLHSFSAEKNAADHQHDEGLFSILVFERDAMEVANLCGTVSFTPQVQAHQEFESEGSLPDLRRWASLLVHERAVNEEPSLIEETTKELTTANAIFLDGSPAPKSRSSPLSIDWAYPIDDGAAPLPNITSSAIEEVVPDLESDTNSPLFLPNPYVALPNSADSNLPLDISSSEAQIPRLCLVTASANAGSSLVNKSQTRYPFDTSIAPGEGKDDSLQDRRNPKQSESPVTVSHMLGISPEPFASPNEFSKLQDALAIRPSCSPIERAPHQQSLEGCVPSSATNSPDAIELDVAPALLNPENQGILAAVFDEVCGAVLVSTGANDIFAPIPGKMDILSVTVSEMPNAERKQVIDDKANPVEPHQAQIKQLSSDSQHTSECPNWALAPIDPPKPTKGSEKQLAKVDSKRFLARRGKQKADDAVSAVAIPQTPTLYPSDHVSTTLAYFPEPKEAHKSLNESKAETLPRDKGQQFSLNQSISNAAISLVGSSKTTSSSEKTRTGRSKFDKNREHIRPNSGTEIVPAPSDMGEDVRAHASTYPHKPAKFTERRAPDSSVSFLLTNPLGSVGVLHDPTLIALGEDTNVKLKEIQKSPTVSNLCDSFSALTLETQGKKVEVETFEDKIVAILSETHRNKHSDIRSLNFSSKKADTLMESQPSSPSFKVPHGSDPARVSWSSDEQEFQANRRPASLPWRAGIAKALSRHLEISQESQHNLSFSAIKHQAILKASANEDFVHHTADKTLQVGHEEFPLHAREYGEPVRVNLPSTVKPLERLERLPDLSQSDFGGTSNHTTRPAFFSHIPVATRVLVNRSVGTENDSVLPIAPMSFVNAESWQSTAPFHLVQRTSAMLTQPDANQLRPGYRYNTVPLPESHPRELGSASQFFKKPKAYQAHQHCVPNLFAETNQTSSSRLSMLAGPAPQTQYPFSALQRAKSREFLNNSYMQGQYCERKHIEHARSNYVGLTDFSMNFQPATENMEWGYTQPSGPSDAPFFRNGRRSVNEPIPSGSQEVYIHPQDLQHHKFTFRNNAK
ncbi:hypothetical protein BDN70DRAFT_893023 [Pholiota conissans]|uniref:Uncharacterized protein n=1 Tax=Pholiota conissans TaxID=109636 RepID=A0A9P5Z755_9AGAR|nr:hypothetical protein BDN70DRAFT_893023 [Pholiota conissans]